MKKFLTFLAGCFNGVRPDITPAMVKATIVFICSQAVAAGLMSAGTQSYILQLCGTLMPVAIVLADVLLRQSRNKAKVAEVFLPEQS